MKNSLTIHFALALSLAVMSAPDAARAQAAAATTAATAAPAKTIIGRSTATLSPAVRVGNLLFLSGTLGGGPDTTIQAQTKRSLDSMKGVLDLAGAKVEDVVKCTVFLINGADFRGMNEAYSAFFPTQPPARSTVVVAALVSAGAKVEIECIAVMR